METKSGSYSARWVPEVDTSIISIASKSVDYASNVLSGLLSGSFEDRESRNLIWNEVIWSVAWSQSPSDGSASEPSVSGISIESISSRMPAALS